MSGTFVLPARTVTVSPGVRIAGALAVTDTLYKFLALGQNWSDEEQIPRYLNGQKVALEALLSTMQAVDQRVAGVSLVRGDFFSAWTSLRSDEQQALKSALILTRISTNYSPVRWLRYDDVQQISIQSHVPKKCPRVPNQQRKKMILAV